MGATPLAWADPPPCSNLPEGVAVASYPPATPMAVWIVGFVYYGVSRALLGICIYIYRDTYNPFPLLIKVSLIINICFGSPKSANTTFRIANTKPILK